ncbi:RNA polymerase sigma factor [Aeromicrobium sp. Root472D3]|uniref:RNA polymerase sigma factor n=1 Tax=Aeromicrobium sp. Root472D3 TaxID=1736540 RepID=UPI0006FBBF85|nr:sigma factor-like helix-turn-helix DNA-binding protein [Aeromicrobium sp. Root472D3]KQX72378.1 hypothetical protein ASD10_15385 [Aeromicrobium sp. Root472D3]
MNSTSEQHLQVLDLHGADLHAVASVLTTDPELAEQLVVVAVRTSLPDDDLGRLSGTVVRAWLDGHPEQLETIVPAAPTPLSRLHELPVHQRASLALCRFGGHTYRQAADLLELPAASVADLLTTSLRALHAAPPADGGVTTQAV